VPEGGDRTNLAIHAAAGFLFFALSLCLIGDTFLSPGARVVGSDQFYDIQFKYLPWKHFTAASFRNGEVPLWNPYILGGVPLAAETEAAPYYPLSLLFLLLPLQTAFNLLTLLHLIMAGFFTYLLARRLSLGAVPATVAGATFMLCGPVALRVYAGHFPILCTMAWLPLLFLLLNLLIDTKRLTWAIALTLATALQITAGHPQYLYYSLLALLLYATFRSLEGFLSGNRPGIAGRVLAVTVASLAAGFALTAIQTIPLLEFIPHSARGALSADQVAEYSFPPENLLTFLFPRFLGDSLGIEYRGRWNFWEMNAYLGIVPLILATIGIFRERNRHTIFFGLLAVLCLLLAIGDHTPLLNLLYVFLPGFRLFRGHSKFIFLTVFSLSILSGYGCRHLLRGSVRKRPASLFLFLTAAAVLAVFFLRFFPPTTGAWLGRWRSLLSHLPLEGTPAAFIPNPLLAAQARLLTSDLSRTLVFLAAFFLLGALRARRLLRARAAGACLLLLVCGDLCLFLRPFMVDFDLDRIFWPEDVVVAARRATGRDRFRLSTSVPFFLPLNSAMIHRLYTAGGCATNLPRDANTLLNLAQQTPPEQFNQLIAPLRPSPLLDLVGLRCVLSLSGDPLPSPLLLPDQHAGGYLLSTNNRALPRAFLVHRTRVIQETSDLYWTLGRGDVQPEDEVILETGGPFSTYPPPGPEPPVQILDSTPRRVALRATLKSPGVLVLSDTFYPGWRVFVDGTLDTIHRADLSLRAVYLTPGTHAVEFV